MPSTITYTVAGGEMLSQRKGGADYDYLPNPLGNIKRTIATGQSLRQQYLYSPWGESDPVSDDENASTPFQFIGAYGGRTQDVGGVYFRARTYSPTYARWLTVDPLWPAAESYIYVNSDPVSISDPSGLQPLDVGSCKLWYGNGPCTEPKATADSAQRCKKAGTLLCRDFLVCMWIETIGETEIRHTICCAECYKKCDTELSGILCGITESELACAYRAIQHWRPGKIDKNPRIERAHCGDCSGGNHYSWACRNRRGQKHGVITAACCFCYKDGIKRHKCWSQQGCH